MRPRRCILIGAAIAFTALLIWLVVSWRDDDSTLNATARYLKETMCWSAESNTACVLKAMEKYEKKGRYDEAINTGATWADKYPENLTSGWIYDDISVLYLRKSKMDNQRAEEYLQQALLFRDKALRSSWDSPYSLQRLATISEAVGDLSGIQRCTQYDNSIKILDRMNLLASEDKDRLARQFKPDLAERKKVECLLDWIEAARKRVRDKLLGAGCDKEHRAAG